jgi:cytidine deaminase
MPEPTGPGRGLRRHSCGGCRQSILEAAHVSGNDIEIISANGDGSEIRVLRISELLPFGFGPANLADAEA